MDEISIFQVTASLAVVLGIIWGLSKAVLYWQQHRHGKSPSQGRRLQLVESLFIDTQNRLVLVKCDEKEHLILLGAKSEVVVSGDPSTDLRSLASFPTNKKEDKVSIQ